MGPEMFRTIVEHSRDGINMLDLATGRYVFMSPSQVAMTGFTAEEMNAFPADEALARVHPEDRELSLRQQERIAAGEDLPGPVHYRWRVKSGEYRWFSDSRTLVRDEQGRPVALVGVSRDITDRKEAEEALRQSEERFRLALVNAPVSVAAMDRDLKFIWAYNQRTYDPREVLGKTDRDLFPRDWERLVDLKRGVLETGVPAREEFWITSNGERVYVDLYVEPMRDDAGAVNGLLIAAVDLTAQKLAEEELKDFNAALEDRIIERTTTIQRQNDLLEKMFSSIHMMVASFDRDFRFLRVNRRYAEAGGHPEAYFVGKNHFELYPHAENEAIFRHVVETGEPCQVYGKPFEYPEFPERGVTYWDWSLIPVKDHDGTVTGLVMSLLDQTEPVRARLALEASARQQRDLNAALRQRAQQLRTLASELAMAEDRERRRLAQVLHDNLQQLLVGAKLSLGAAMLLEDPEARLPLHAEASRLLDESLAVSRSLTVELAPPVLYDRGFPDALHWLARRKSEKHRLEVTVVAGERSDRLPVETRVVLYQVLRELLFNVVKHAGVAQATVAMTVAPDGAVEVVVADEGVGFEPALLDASARTSGGFGLLSARERIAALGGTLTIDSAPGQGTRTTVRLPVAGSAAAAPAAVAEADASSREPLRVLLADDHRIMREGLVRLLAEEPDLVVIGEATDGREAVELARRLRPDVVVLDVSMPHLAGEAAARQIRAALPACRIVALSMHAAAERRSSMREAGADVYLEKTGASEFLVSAIRGLDQS